MKTFKEWESKAKYKPLNRFMSCGNEIQVCGLIFPHKVHVTERTFFPWNFMKSPSTYWVLDLILPNSVADKVKEFEGELTDKYYTDEGYGMPEFTDLEKAYQFNEYYNENMK
jgi:hypothetical protein